MKYDAKTKKLIIEVKQLDNVYFLIMYALKNMRIAHGITLDKYERVGMLTDHDHAALAIVEIAENLGIDLGVTRHDHNKLDLREF